MAKNEKTSQKLASLASQALKDPKALTPAQIRSLAGSVLTQALDTPAPKKTKKGRK